MNLLNHENLVVLYKKRELLKRVLQYIYIILFPFLDLWERRKIWKGVSCILTLIHNFYFMSASVAAFQFLYLKLPKAINSYCNESIYMIYCSINHRKLPLPWPIQSKCHKGCKSISKYFHSVNALNTSVFRIVWRKLPLPWTIQSSCINLCRSIFTASDCLAHKYIWIAWHYNQANCDFCIFLINSFFSNNI